MTTSAFSGCVPSPRGNKAGFTLAEMVLAITVVAVALSMFAVTLGLSARAVNSSRRQMTAMNFARQELEELRGQTFNSTQLVNGTYSFSNSAFSGQYVISTVVTNQRKQIRMQINWVNAARGNDTTNVTYTTWISRAMH